MKKGFTLIELLAVIVILAIIALIATPIILGIINDARKESQERSIELYASAAKNAVAKYQLNNTSAPTSFEQLDIEYDGDVVCTTKELYADGSIYLADCTVNGDAVDYTYGEPKGSSVSKACTIERQDASKYSVGDVVTCTLSESTDKFYIIEEQSLTATTVQMLTEKSIHTTEYRQSDSAGTIAFSSTNYWSSTTTYPTDVYNDNSLLYPIVEEYVSYLNTKLKGATGGLLTYAQAENLGCRGISGGSCAPGINGGGNGPTWVYSTTYWTGSAYTTEVMWNIVSYGAFEGIVYNDSNYRGIRPVITISTSEIQ